MKNWQIYEMIAALCTFIFIGSATCFLITLLHLQLAYSMVWALIAICSALCGFYYYGRYEQEGEN